MLAKDTHPIIVVIERPDIETIFVIRAYDNFVTIGGDIVKAVETYVKIHLCLQGKAINATMGQFVELWLCAIGVSRNNPVALSLLKKLNGPRESKKDDVESSCHDQSHPSVSSQSNDVEIGANNDAEILELIIDPEKINV